MDSSHTLDPARAERVLERLGFAAAPDPSPDSLADLYRAWCLRVPFDNLRKRVHVHAADPSPLPGDTPADFFDAWCATGAGGTCWAGNGALCALLQTLGFPARRGVATMIPPPEMRPAELPPNHGTVTVDFGDGPWLVDASILHDTPLRLAPGPVGDPLWGVGMRAEEGRWHVHWRPLGMPVYMDCRIETTDAAPDEFSERHERTRTWSIFNRAVNFRINRPGHLAGIVRGHAILRAADGTETRTPLDSDAMRRYLVDELGIAEALAARIPEDDPETPR